MRRLRRQVAEIAASQVGWNGNVDLFRMREAKIGHEADKIRFLDIPAQPRIVLPFLGTRDAVQPR